MCVHLYWLLQRTKLWAEVLRISVGLATRGVKLCVILVCHAFISILNPYSGHLCHTQSKYCLSICHTIRKVNIVFPCLLCLCESVRLHRVEMCQIIIQTTHIRHTYRISSQSSPLYTQPVWMFGLLHATLQRNDCTSSSFLELVTLSEGQVWKKSVYN